MERIGNYDPLEIEPRILEFWQKHDIYKKAKKKANGKKFYYLDGPPYTSGRIHIGHAWGRALRDSLLRYKRMQGFDVWDRAGFDMHGLPTEHATQKKLGIKDKEDIEKFGMEKFIKECKKLSVENMHLMIKDFIRLAIWIDFENPYMPINNSYIEGVWWLIKKAHENDRLYQGLKTMPWCFDCSTAVAKHELEYETVNDNSIFLKFRLIGDKEEYLIVWTTTAWTIPFNLAVMVNPKVDYVKCSADGEIWIVARDLIESVSEITKKNLQIVEIIKGKDLEGLKYTHPFENEIYFFKEIEKKNNKVHTVVLSEEFVETSSGTGLVHCAPGCGPEDYEVGHRNGLPPFNNVDEKGLFKDMGRFTGWKAKLDDKKFIEALDEKGVLTANKKISHDYPHCWRCKNPVIFRATTQWFFKIEDLKENMKEINKDIKWVPDWAGSRQFHSWLDNLRDNNITKQRYWGTPLPVWQADDGDYIVVGDAKELKKLAGEVPEDLHKPWIDNVIIRKNGKEYKKIPDVLDVWVDAGCASWLCLDYPVRKDLFEELFPADFILEGKDQIRGWFNLLFIASMVSMNKHSFNAVYMHGFVQDSQGRKMSKSLGNIISPDEVISKYGADTLRYYLIGGANAGVDINYNFDDMKVKYRNLSVLWNLHKYVIDLKNEGVKLVKKPKAGIEEQYMLSLLNSKISEITKLFDEFRINEVPSKVEEIFLELSRTYIQLTRDKAAGSKEEKEAVFCTVYYALTQCLKLFTPIAPYICEEIYKNLKDAFGLKEESISLYEWPKANKKMINKELESHMETAKTLIQAVLHAREKAHLGVRWPLKEITIATKSKEIKEAAKKLKELIKSQANVKDVLVKEDMGIKKKIMFDYKKIQPDFKEKTTALLARLAMIPQKDIIEKIEKEGEYSIIVDSQSFKLEKKHLMIEKEIPGKVVDVEIKDAEIYLNLERDEKLVAEGFTREIARRIQALRKDNGLTKDMKIGLYIKAPQELEKGIGIFKKQLQEKVGAGSLAVSSLESSKKHKINKEEVIKDKKFLISFDVM